MGGQLVPPLPTLCRKSDNLATLPSKSLRAGNRLVRDLPHQSERTVNMHLEATQLALTYQEKPSTILPL